MFALSGNFRNQFAARRRILEPLAGKLEGFLSNVSFTGADVQLFVPAAVGIVFISMFQATGKGFRALIISFTRQLVFILPVAFIISKLIGNESLIWLAFPIAEIGSLILAISLFINLTKTDFKKLDAKG